MARFNGKCDECGTKFSRENDGPYEVLKGTCDCGRPLYLHKVSGKVVTDILCDWRCLGAHRDLCECSCGGANHGAANDPWFNRRRHVLGDEDTTVLPDEVGRWINLDGAAARREIEALERAAEVAAFLARFPRLQVVRRAVKADKVTNEFVLDVMAKLERYGSLSDRQVAAVTKAYAKSIVPQPEEAPKVPVPVGRQVIEGKVVRLKWVEDNYNPYGGGTLKMLVVVTTPQGEFKVWGTVPASLLGNTYNEETNELLAGIQEGETVRFTATAERSDRDESFGFYKRPTKAEILRPSTVA